jgi:hypothetical protein
MANLSLRGLDEEMKECLRSEARRRNLSVNTLLLHLIRQGIGLAGDGNRPKYHDLDDLAGTWSAADAEEFTAATAAFGEIDAELW